MSSLFLNYSHDDGCPWHRFLVPARFCAPDFEPSGHRVVVGGDMPDGHDWYGCHGLPTAYTLMQVGRWRRRGARFLWSVDDSWLEVPDWNPARPGEDGLDSYYLAKELADLILVSTPHLASTFADVAHKVVCAPNLVDVSGYPRPPDTLAVELPVRVVWSGGRTHAKDIEVLSPVVEAVLKRFGPEKVQFVYFGMTPPHPILRDWLRKGVLYQPAVAFQQYERVRNTLKPDVWLAPLSKVPFNLSKSNLRLLEGFGLLGAVVATPYGEYNCIRPGQDGRLADSVEEWVGALSRLVTDHEYRLDLAVNGRKRVEAEYDWGKWECRRPWHEALARVFGCDLPSKPTP